MTFVQAPQSVTFDELRSKGSLSPSSYQRIMIKNPNKRKVEDLIKPLIKGKEVGSSVYVEKSNYHFVRTRALQPNSLLLSTDSESIVPIIPKFYKDYDLSSNDILYSKDSNIGECCIINSHQYKNYSICAGLFKIVPKKHTLYIFAFLKHLILKEQVKTLSAKGSIFRHAKDNVLDCIIPFPNQSNREEIIDYVETLTKIAISTEMEIRNKNGEINNIIKNEIRLNQKLEKFRYRFPKLHELREVGRLDTGMYNEKFKNMMFEIENYKHEYDTLEGMKFDVRRGQNLQMSAIGNSIYLEKPRKNYYPLILPTYVSEYRTIEKLLYLGNKNDLETLKPEDVLFGAEGVGKGKATILCDVPEKAISNIHAILINSDHASLNEKIFIGFFLSYLRSLGLYKSIGVGTAGGHIPKKMIETMPIPNFPKHIVDQIGVLYHNRKLTNVSYDELKNEEIFRNLGVFQLNSLFLKIMEKLDEIIRKITDNEFITIETPIISLNPNN